MEKARRMKLDKLHVGDLNARPPRHGHAVSRRDIRVSSI